jgi:N-acetyl-anhydromuramyl-L-alanine amidase AmpD
VKSGVHWCLAGLIALAPAFPARATSPKKPAPKPSTRGSTAPRPVWRYIVIHHSGTTTGNAAQFDKSHRRRGMENGLAYHFVIDNGTAGRRDGQLETGARWLRQLPGGHCHQEHMNRQGIGICLVGDFTRRAPTSKQMSALVSLVNTLRKRYGIPLSNVRGHGQWPGESSQCPGRAFPWTDFKRRLERGR